MKFCYVILICFGCFLSLELKAADQFNIVPQVLESVPAQGVFALDGKVEIVATKQCRKEALYLREALEERTALRLKKGTRAGGKKIVLRLSDELADLGPEGYRLEVTAKHIQLEAYTNGGLFYAVQTLLQILPREPHGNAWQVPSVKITDKPRFSWRGLMLDCSRTFQSVDYLKKTIDVMAVFKMNVLHLHLTDDQGWRLEIKRYPELTKKGARFADKWNEPESYNGFYTQDEIRELVAYAQDRNVTIVPEIELPGHSLAALACYPELSCAGGPFEIDPYMKGIRIHQDIFCAGNEKTFDFLRMCWRRSSHCFLPSISILEAMRLRRGGGRSARNVSNASRMRRLKTSMNCRAISSTVWANSSNPVGRNSWAGMRF